MQTWRQDLRYALRMLRQTPALTAVIIVSLAIGIGANTAIFSVVDALLLRPLPYPQPERLANIWIRSPGIGIFRDWPSPGQYSDLLNENHSFEEISISRLITVTLTVVGVVGTVKQYGLDDEGKIAVYFPQNQNADNNMFLAVRTSSDPASLAQAVSGEIHAVDPSVVVYQVRTMQERLYDSLARQRFAMAMLGAFALFALILAAVGVYGVMSYLVAQSTHDIGVRLALGAPRSSILAMVTRQGMTLAAAGMAAGLSGAMGLTRVMSSLLFGVSATDAIAYSAVAAILAGVAMIAAWVPARRATRVDPMIALRDE